MIQFQILDISSDDIKIEGEETKIIITLYGKSNMLNEQGFNKNIVCHIEGFRPYFYLKYPDNWSNTFIRNSFFGERYLNMRNYIYNLVNATLPPKSKEFYGYHLDKNNEEKEFKFIKLEFINHDYMKKVLE